MFINFQTENKLYVRGKKYPAGCRTESREPKSQELWSSLTFILLGLLAWVMPLRSPASQAPPSAELASNSPPPPVNAALLSN